MDARGVSSFEIPGILSRSLHVRSDKEVDCKDDYR